ncbi:MAG: caspase family protein [Planctomycetaceae bacterium]|nr:caspase family protein [Planctomycetaceae bacterium]
MSQLRRISVIALVVVAGFAPAATAQTQKMQPNLTVLTIGVSQYKKTAANDLKHAAKDARDLAAALKAHEGKLFDRVQTRTLTDAQATRQNIEEALDWLAKQVKANDYVIVFVSGHGNIDSLGHYYFVPHDYEPGRGRTAVRWTLFHDTLSRLPGRRFLILDTCRAGSAGGLGAPVSPTESLKGLTEQGLITYAACMAGEYSFEPSNHGPIQNGYFTCALLEALAGKADANGDGTVTLAEADAYVANRVKGLSRGLQNPTMQRPWTIPSSLALALVGKAQSSVPASSMPFADLSASTPQSSDLPASSMPIADLSAQSPPATGPFRPEVPSRQR